VINQTEIIRQGTAVNMVIPNFFGNALELLERQGRGLGVALMDGPGGKDNEAGAGIGTGAAARDAAGLAAPMIAASSGGSGDGDQPPQLRRGAGVGQGEGAGEGEGDADGTGGGNGKQPAAGRGGEGGGRTGADEAPRKPQDRGSLLQPIIDSLASKGAEGKVESFVLSRLQEGSLMGNHLLDALALGAGVGYGVYAPRAVGLGQRTWSRLVNRVQRVTGLGQASAAIREQRVISIVATTLDSGRQRLVAARVSGDGLTVLAQLDLPEGTTVDMPGAQAQVDYTTRQLMDRLRSSGLNQHDQVLIDPRLQNQAPLMQGMASSTDLLNTATLHQSLTRCSDAERQQLQQWLKNPSQALADSHPLAQLLQQRTAAYGRSMPPQQAAMATMVELGIALAADQPAVS
jgi:hypothetical protein